MPIQYRCPHCGAEGSADNQYAGQTGPCAACGKSFAIAAASTSPPHLPSARSSSSSAGAIIGIVATVAVAGVCAIVLLIVLMIPAVQISDGAAKRMQCANNLKQISFAMHMYHDAFGSFPPANTVDNQGRPLHSWRVLLLPYLEQGHLHQQIKLDEPWDSPHNRQFHDRIIQIYTCPSSSGDPTETNYMVVIGDETAFPPDGKSSKLAEVQDGPSNTILLTETIHSGANWMEPVDLSFADMTFAPNTGRGEAESEHPGIVQVALADGSIRAIADDVDQVMFKALLTRSGGEPIVDAW